MTFNQFIIRLSGWLTIAANVVVLFASIRFYIRRARLSVLLIAISAALGAMRSAVFWIAQSWSPAAWNVLNVAFGLDLVFWTVGICLLFREFSKHEKHAA
jgi:hypothetical protein